MSRNIYGSSDLFELPSGLSTLITMYVIIIIISDNDNSKRQQRIIDYRYISTTKIAENKINKNDE